MIMKYRALSKFASSRSVFSTFVRYLHNMVSDGLKNSKTDEKICCRDGWLHVNTASLDVNYKTLIKTNELFISQNVIYLF